MAQRHWKYPSNPTNGRSSLSIDSPLRSPNSNGNSNGRATSSALPSTNIEKGDDKIRDSTVTVMEMIRTLSCSDQANAQSLLYALTGSTESCQSLRRAGCIPLLVQILHPLNIPAEAQPSSETKQRASQTLRNIVLFNWDEKLKLKELKVLKLLESIRIYIEQLKQKQNDETTCNTISHPVSKSVGLMKMSFDQDYKSIMCQLGAIHSLADLIQTDHVAHGINEDSDCITMRRYNCMTLTNLTMQEKRNKVLLGTMKDFMIALVEQLNSPNEDICQVAVSLLRNLSQCSSLKAPLGSYNAVKKLLIAAMKATKDVTLKASILALWNLSNSSTLLKLEFCETPNAIEFLVRLLESPILSCVENSGGILANIVNVINRDEVTRDRFFSTGIVDILISHLQSTSPLVVANACEILSQSSDFERIREQLLQCGAIRKMKILANSKHDRIRLAAASTLRNLLSSNTNDDLPVVSALPQHMSQPKETEQCQPIDLRTKLEPDLCLDQNFSEPLDLSCHSSKSTPVHVVSSTEFGANHLRCVPFLNPPLQEKRNWGFNSVTSYNSCPEFFRHLRYAPPAHTSSAQAEEFVKTEEISISRSTDATVNYSLHFTDTDDVTTIGKNEDTVKTYCCEGTPLNFSTSNSMTDLTQVERQPKLKPILESENPDDFPRKYFTESTPATFSRASSLSSIASNSPKADGNEEIAKTTNNGQGKEKSKRNVTFSAADTPLMFSRTSSVNSLESFDINYDDGGSVVSEFSRRTSEAVSPSELPDSPRQSFVPLIRNNLVKPLPKPFPEKQLKVREESDDTIKVYTKGESRIVSGVHSVQSLSPLTIEGDAELSIAVIKPEEIVQPAVTPQSSNLPKPVTCNTDEVKIFGIEGTPWKDLSTATSLSDLVSDLEKEQLVILNEKQVLKKDEEPSTSPPPLPPKPTNKLVDKRQIDPVYVDNGAEVNLGTQRKLESVPEEVSANSGSSKIPKSQSEATKLSAKGLKMSSSYQENLKRENQLDPELAALIMKGKSRVKSGKSGSSNSQKHVQPRNIEPDSKANDSQPHRKNVEPEKTKENEISKVQDSVVSQASEWSEDSLSLSVPSLSISAAFKMVQSNSTVEEDVTPIPPVSETTEHSPQRNEPGDIWLLQQSTITGIEPPTELSDCISSTGCKKNQHTSSMKNLKLNIDTEVDNSIISVASLKTEVASISALEEGFKDLSIEGDTYVQSNNNVGSDATDADDSFLDDNSSLNDCKDLSNKSSNENEDLLEKKMLNNQNIESRYRTYTSKKHPSPRERRREDPGRYLTHTITQEKIVIQDKNGNPSSISPSLFSTFRIDRSPKIMKPMISGTSNDSSPSNSPKGIRGRRKLLYSSLPPNQKKSGPPIPPKPRTPVPGTGVRSTRTSELRAANSRDSSPKQSRTSSRSSSTNSLSNSNSNHQLSQHPSKKKVPPKPPTRTTPRNFGFTKPVHSSNSTIGFVNQIDSIPVFDGGSSTLPRTIKINDGGNNNIAKENQTKVGKLSNFWNHFVKGKADGNKNNTSFGGSDDHEIVQKKTNKFGFNFGRKKKTIEVNENNAEIRVGSFRGWNQLSTDEILHGTSEKLKEDVSSEKGTSSTSTFHPSSKITPV